MGICVMRRAEPPRRVVIRRLKIRGVGGEEEEEEAEEMKAKGVTPLLNRGSFTTDRRAR